MLYCMDGSFYFGRMEKLYQLFLNSSGICIDTRKLSDGQLFFALKGENFDGNKFAAKALESGASASVVDDADMAISGDERVIVVGDAYQTLVDLAKYHRARLTIPIIAITGSNGKTTTKELLHAVLSKKYNCSATKGNFNNHIGVPLTLLEIDSSIEIAIVEMGANHQGEIDYLAHIAAPTHGLITNIGKAHLEGFGGIEGVKKGKSELYRYLAKSKGHVFLNFDDHVLSSLVPLEAESVIKYLSSDFEILQAFPEVQLKINGMIVDTALTGAYNVQNIAAAFAIGDYFEVESSSICAAVQDYTPSNNRSQLKKIGSNTYILDSYNANPSSMHLSIQNLATGRDTKTSVLILGDMKEVGIEEIQEHQSILKVVGRFEWRAVYTVGAIFCSVSDNPYPCFASVDDLNEYLSDNPISNSYVLLKASRSINLDRVILQE